MRGLFDLYFLTCFRQNANKNLHIDLLERSGNWAIHLIFTDSCMHRWMTMARIPARRATGFESNLKLLNIDEQVVRTQPTFNGRKMGDVLTLAFFGSQDYAENFRGCISKFLSSLVPFRLNLHNNSQPARWVNFWVILAKACHSKFFYSGFLLFLEQQGAHEYYSLTKNSGAHQR